MQQSSGPRALDVVGMAVFAAPNGFTRERACRSAVWRSGRRRGVGWSWGGRQSWGACLLLGCRMFSPVHGALTAIGAVAGWQGGSTVVAAAAAAVTGFSGLGRVGWVPFPPSLSVSHSSGPRIQWTQSTAEHGPPPPHTASLHAPTTKQHRSPGLDLDGRDRARSSTGNSTSPFFTGQQAHPWRWAMERASGQGMRPFKALQGGAVETPKGDQLLGPITPAHERARFPAWPLLACGISRVVFLPRTGDK